MAGRFRCRQADKVDQGLSSGFADKVAVMESIRGDADNERKSEPTYLEDEGGQRMGRCKLARGEPRKGKGRRQEMPWNCNLERRNKWAMRIRCHSDEKCHSSSGSGPLAH